MKIEDLPLEISMFLPDILTKEQLNTDINDPVFPEFSRYGFSTKVPLLHWACLRQNIVLFQKLVEKREELGLNINSISAGSCVPRTAVATILTTKEIDLSFAIPLMLAPLVRAGADLTIKFCNTYYNKANTTLRFPFDSRIDDLILYAEYMIEFLALIYDQFGAGETRLEKLGEVIILQQGSKTQHEILVIIAEYAPNYSMFTEKYADGEALEHLSYHCAKAYHKMKILDTIFEKMASLPSNETADEIGIRIEAVKAAAAFCLSAAPFPQYKSKIKDISKQISNQIGDSEEKEKIDSMNIATQYAPSNFLIHSTPIKVKEKFGVASVKSRHNDVSVQKVPQSGFIGWKWAKKSPSHTLSSTKTRTQQKRSFWRKK